MKYLLILLIQLFSAIILFAQYDLESSTESIGGGLQSSSTLFLYSNFGQFSGGQSQNSNFKLNDGFIYYLTEYTLLAEEPSSHSNQFAIDSVLSAASIRFAIQPAEQIGALGYIVLAKEGGKPTISKSCWRFSYHFSSKCNISTWFYYSNQRYFSFNI